MMHCIVYYSYSVYLQQEAALQFLLEQCRHNNAQAEITGILLFIKGSIIQVLEGEKLVVEALFNKVEADERHASVTKVINQPINQRRFADWSMGLKNISPHQLAVLKTIIDLGDTSWLTTEPSEHIILNMLKIFYEGSIYN